MKRNLLVWQHCDQAGVRERIDSDENEAAVLLQKCPEIFNLKRNEIILLIYMKKMKWIVN